jgi:hypothetical protein
MEHMLSDCVAVTERPPQYEARPLRKQPQEQSYHRSRRARLLRMKANVTSANTASANFFFMIPLL